MSSKLREALENIVHHFCSNCPNNGPDGCELSEAEGRFEFKCHKLKQARAALAEPLRNCDVGTAEKQYNRFDHCCSSRKISCRRSYAYGCAECYSKWSQMPYESSEQTKTTETKTNKGE